MISDINAYVDFLTKNKISEHQFLILWLVHTKDKENIKKYKQSFGEFDLHALQALIDRNWLDDFGLVTDNIRTFNIYDFIVTDKFTNVVVIDEEDSYEELCKVYPNWLFINGVKIPAVTGDPSINSKEYFRYHKGNRLAHQRVVSILRKWFANKPYAQEKISNFILNRRWNLLDEEMNKGVGQDMFKTL